MGGGSSDGAGRARGGSNLTSAFKWTCPEDVHGVSGWVMAERRQSHLLGADVVVQLHRVPPPAAACICPAQMGRCIWALPLARGHLFPHACIHPVPPPPSATQFFAAAVWPVLDAAHWASWAARRALPVDPDARGSVHFVVART